MKAGEGQGDLTGAGEGRAPFELRDFYGIAGAY